MTWNDVYRLLLLVAAVVALLEGNWSSYIPAVGLAAALEPRLL